jgi:hypothetical protein
MVYLKVARVSLRDETEINPTVQGSQTKAPYERNLRMNRKHNSAGAWQGTLSPLIADIQETIHRDIEGPTARLGLGASVLSTKIFMLDFTARNDPDAMVFTSFQETVEDGTQKMQPVRGRSN